MLQNLRFSARTLRRSPGFALIAILSLGLGVGANAVIFSWMDALVLRPFPLVEEPDRLTRIQTRSTSGGMVNVSYPDYLDWREQAGSFDGMAAYSLHEFGLRETGADTAEPAERVWGLYASGNYFDVLLVQPLLGRALTPADESVASAPVAVLGYGLWQRRFHGDPGIVGREITLNGKSVTVVGVAPPRFGGTVVGLSFDLWVPVTMLPLLQDGSRMLESRGNRWLDVVGRLQPGVTLEQARAELAAIGERISAAYPQTSAGRSPWPLPFDQDGGAQEQARPVLLMLLGMTALVLLIACANVANLLLARAMARRREMGIRVAVGAGRVHLVRQLLTESFLLALAGGAVGLLITLWSGSLLAYFIPPSPFPVQVDVTISGRVLALAGGLTVLTTLLFGLMPALRASRPDVTTTLKAGDTAPATGARLRSGLVIAQVALAVVAITSAGLFVRSLQQAERVDPGFHEPGQVLLAATNLRLAGYSDTTAHAVVARLIERAETLPGVSRASAASTVPLGFGGWSTWDIEAEGYEARPEDNMTVMANAVAPGYFETMGTTIVRGRAIEAGDRRGASEVVILNETAARRFWPEQDPIGRRIRVGGRWLTVVGIAQDGKYSSLVEPTPPFLYLALNQWNHQEVTLHLRTAGDPHGLIPLLRREFAAVDPGLPFLDPRTLEKSIGAALMLHRLAASLLGAFGTLALILAAIGIYGVLAYVVARRTREIGIRLALGATHGTVLGTVFRDGARLTGIGLVLGIAIALGVARLLQSQLFGIEPADPLSFGAAALLLGAVALLAIYLPARRATRVDPMIALRTD